MSALEPVSPDAPRALIVAIKAAMGLLAVILLIGLLTACTASAVRETPRGSLITAYMLGVYMGKERPADATAAVALQIPQVRADDLLLARSSAEALYTGLDRTVHHKASLDMRECYGLDKLFHEFFHSAQHQRRLCSGKPGDCEPPAYAAQDAWLQECLG